MCEQSGLLLLDVLNEEGRHLVSEQCLVICPDLALHLRVQVVIQVLVPHLARRSATPVRDEASDGVIAETNINCQVMTTETRYLKKK